MPYLNYTLTSTFLNDSLAPRDVPCKFPVLSHCRTLNVYLDGARLTCLRRHDDQHFLLSKKKYSHQLGLLPLAILVRSRSDFPMLSSILFFILQKNISQVTSYIVIVRMFTLHYILRETERGQHTEI